MAHKPLRVHSVLPRDREASGEVVSAREVGIWVKFLLPNPVLLILKPMAILSNNCNENCVDSCGNSSWTMLPKWRCFGKKTITLAPDSGWLPSVVQVSSINLFTKQEIYSARFWLACYALLPVCLCCSKQDKKELLGFLSHFGSHRKNSTRHSIQFFFYRAEYHNFIFMLYTKSLNEICHLH